MRKFLFLIVVCLFATLAWTQSGSQKKEPAATKPAEKTAAKANTSLDVTALDKTADPCKDFFQYACGGWVKNHAIPADQAVWGRFSELVERNRTVLHEILEQAAAASKRTPNEQKIGDYYASCMDEAAINKKGVAALKPEFDLIDGLKDKSELPALVAHMRSQGINVFFGFGSGADFKNAKMNIAQADQAGLSLPDRDYYLKDDPKSGEIRNGYVTHLTKMFELLGDDRKMAQMNAAAVMVIETALAKGSMDRVERREPEKVYHKISSDEWQALSPSFSTARYLAALGAPKFTSLNVASPGFFKTMDEEIKTENLDDLKTYLRWHLARSQAADHLPTALGDESFNFYGKTLTGAKERQPRWKRCVRATDGDLGDALGQEFVDKHFPPAAKARMLTLVKQLEDALRDDIQGLPWMSDTTKKQALIKLAAIQNKIGYPAKWKDYSTVKIVREDALGNSLRANEYGVRRDLAKIGQPLDKQEWQMTPPTVNAYYDPTENDINFPAGILQPPFFDFNADDALNLGGIGAVIGHELTHGFDDQGRLFDAEGNLHDWWTPEDGKAFEQRAQCEVDEYNGFVAVDDVHLNGKLTLGENTADNGGLRIAHMALMTVLAQEKHTPANIDGFSPDQRLFLSWGQVWCQSMRPEIARMLAQTNEHSPGHWRVNGVVQNMPEFQKAWGCKEGQPMVAKNACRVW